MIIFINLFIYLLFFVQIYSKEENNILDDKKNDETLNNICNIYKTFDFAFNKNNTGLCINLNFTTKNFLIAFFTFFGIIFLISLIYSFYQVPYWKGYKCRCCQRTKWFFKTFVWIIFLPCILIYYMINGLFGCLDGMFPDTKLKDAKLNESEEYEEKKNKKTKNNFHELNEEEQQN
jgi:hypothetical protein